MDHLNFLPIVQRELLLASRRPMTFWSRCIVVGLGALAAMGMLFVSVSSGRPAAQMGQDMFWAQAAIGFIYALLAGPVIAADSLSSEKRQGTLGLLFLTDLRGHDIVLGKLAAVLWPALYGLLAMIPVLALPFMIGGVSGGEFLRLALGLALTMCFSMSVALLVSAWEWEGRMAILNSTAFILLIGAAAPAAALMAPPQSTLWAVADSLSLFSPALLVYRSSSVVYAVEAAAFWKGACAVGFLTVTHLVLAARVAPRRWSTVPPSWVRAGFSWVREQAVRPFRKNWSNRRSHWLEEEPCLWLGTRGQENDLLAWLLVGGVVAGFLWALTTLAPGLVIDQIIFATVYLGHTLIKLWIAWEASRRYSEDRQTGALEAILTSPVGEGELTRGYMLGLKRRFLGPTAALVLVDLFFLLDGFSSSQPALALAYVVTIGMFVGDSYAIAWVGLWQGVSAASPVRAFVRTIGLVLVMPWVAFLGLAGVLGLGLGLTGSVMSISAGMMIAIWFAFGYVTDFFMCALGMARLGEDFRTMLVEGE